MTSGDALIVKEVKRFRRQQSLLMLHFLTFTFDAMTHRGCGLKGRSSLSAESSRLIEISLQLLSAPPLLFVSPRLVDGELKLSICPRIVVASSIDNIFLSLHSKTLSSPEQARKHI